MSTSHDGQYGPAQIVWQDTAPGAPAAWAGPGAFDEEPAANGATDGAANDTAAAGESDAQQSPSLSSAWASWSTPQEAEQQAAPEAAPAESAPAGSVAPAESAAPAETAAPAEFAAPAAQEPAPGPAPQSQPFDPSATIQHAPHDEGADSYAEPFAPADQRSGQDSPQSGQGQENGYGQQSQQGQYDPYAQQASQAPAGHDPYAAPQSQREQGGQGTYDPYAAPQSQGGQGAYDPYAQQAAAGGVDQQPDNGAAPGYSGMAYVPPAERAQGGAPAAPAYGAPGDSGGAQQSGAAQDAWSAYQQGADSDRPMATDPSAGEAIPTPPAADDRAGSSTGSAASEPADDEALTIGRSRDNSIVLDDMLVSRRHLRITADDEGLLLEDLGSRNGTYVNGRRVERAHLQEGDRIGVGGTTFEVRNDWLVTI